MDACREALVSLVSVLHSTSSSNHNRNMKRSQSNTRDAQQSARSARVGAEAETEARPAATPLADAVAALPRCVSAPQLEPALGPSQATRSSLRFEGLGHFRNDVLFVHVDLPSRALLRQIFGAQL